MIEKLVNSKTRLKILKLFLSHIDGRYYLRELERLLDESLSPLRRQLLKLTSMRILITEEEANLKYYRLNKNFEGLEELKKIVLDEEVPDWANKDGQYVRSNSIDNKIAINSPKQVRYDLVLLSFISIFVLITAIFVVYANTKSMKQMAKLISNSDAELSGVRSATTTNNGEMMSKKWKVIPSNVPVLSNGETGEEKKSKEL